MTLSASPIHTTTELRGTAEPAPKPRFGGVLWRISRLTRPAMLPLAGKRWNPIFAVVEHRGRKTGRVYRVPVAARRSGDGFIIALAFGAQVDWYRNMVAAGGGTIHWRGEVYSVAAPERVDAATVLPTFDPAQRRLLQIAGIDGYVQVRDAESSHA
jgi:deazaflavin-dependent oxidoreductase (nitroreductase family)